MGSPIRFTEEGFVMAATVVGTLPVANPGVVSSTVTIVETTSAGTVLAPATYTVTPPTGPAPANGGTFTFTAGIGSSLSATQVDTNAAGLSGPPFTTPPFVVTNPAPSAPSGPISFAVTGVTP